MNITCPRCDLAFETQATTNTRCRRCKTVVRVGAGPPGQSRRAPQPAPDEPAADLAGDGLIVVAAGVVILALYVVPAIIRFVRGHHAAEEAPTFCPVGPGGSTPPTPGHSRPH